MPSYIATCDIGTTVVRCFIHKVGDELVLVGSSIQEVSLISPKPGHIEINPEELWQSFCVTIKESIKNAGICADQVTCLGLTTQRSTFTVWDRKHGQPLINFITWKDLRADNMVKKWNNSWTMKALRFISSILYFVSRNNRFLAASIMNYANNQSNIKLKWVLENNSEANAANDIGDLCFGTLDTWLIYKLTNGEIFATEHSNASGTAIYDPFIKDWSGLLKIVLKYKHLNFALIRDTNGVWGNTHKELFGAEIPITAVVSDQGAALFGGCGFDQGDLKITLGTGAFLDVNTSINPHASIRGIYPVVGWKDKEGLVYMAEGASNDIGNIIEWGKKMGFYSSPQETSLIAESVDDSDGLFFIPCFKGIQAPINDSCATGGFLGIKSDTRPEHFVRAMLEAISFRIYQIFVTVKVETNFSIPKLSIDGGVSRNDFILQTLATLTNLQVERPNDVEASSLGCCFLAGIGAGIWEAREDVKRFRKIGKTFYPQEEQREKLLKVFGEWVRALHRFTQWYPKKDMDLS